MVGTKGIEEYDIPLTDGDIGGVNGEGDIIDTDEGEPGGEGIAKPVDTYNGQSSKELKRKKTHTHTWSGIQLQKS